MKSVRKPKTKVVHVAEGSVPAVLKNLRYITSALQGAASWDDSEHEYRRLLIGTAGEVIFDAAHQGPLHDLVNLEAAVPAHYLSRLKDLRFMSRTNAAKEDSPANAVKANMPKTAPGTPIRRLTEKEFAARHAKLAKKIQVMLDECDALSPSSDPGFAAQQVVEHLWRTLAQEHEDNLPPRLAALRAKIAPFPEPPWSGSADDCLKAAWVCEHLLLQLERNIDPPEMWPGWLTVTEAEAISEIDRGVISRACDRGEIESNSLHETDRRINPISLAMFKGKRKAPEPKEPTATVPRAIKDRGTWKCNKCGKQWPEGPHALETCRECNSKATFSPPPKITRATLRNQ